MNLIRKSKSSLSAAVLLSAFFIVSSPLILSAQQKQSVASLPFKKVDATEVCMVNDAVMGTPQIPVKVGDKTYYGCCEGCVATLQNKRSMRYGKDPLTGKEVDKAMAVIISGPAGKALYFESSETARKYLASKKKQ